MEPKGVSRDEFLKDLVKIINDKYPSNYFVPKKKMMKKFFLRINICYLINGCKSKRNF